MEKVNKSIKEWMGVFKDLYYVADSDRTPEQMWTAVMAHCSSIGESIRKVAFKDLMKSAAHTFCWLCSFINKCNSLPTNDIFSYSDSLSEIVTLKYPNRCGHCIEAPCSCNPVKMEAVKDKSGDYRKLLDLRNRDLGAFSGYSIDKFQDMFYDIYCERGHIQTLENTGFHFLEEIGEASVNIRKLSQLRNVAADEGSGVDENFLTQISSVDQIVKSYIEYYEDYFKEENLILYTSKKSKMIKARIIEAKMGLVSEIGDSFSWFCGVLNKVDSISKSIWDFPENYNIRTLEEQLIEEYYNDDGYPICPTCKGNPCQCIFYIPKI